MSLRFTRTAGCLLLAAVTGSAMAVPPCNVVAEHSDQRRAAAAGCYIRQSGKLLLVRQRFGGKLGFPGGFANLGERAQCTAHRETWEETGMQVEVGALATEFGNGFLLYRCRLLLFQDVTAETIPVPESGRAEVSQILWVDPRTVPHSRWRFPWQVPKIMRLFDQGLE